MNTYGKTNWIDSLIDNLVLADGSSAAAAITSTAFKYKHSNYNTRILVVADTAITIVATKLMKVDLLQCATVGGTYVAAAAALNLVAPTGNTVYAIGDIIAEIVIPDSLVTSGNYLEITITNDEDQTAAKVSAFTTNCY